MNTLCPHRTKRIPAADASPREGDPVREAIDQLVERAFAFLERKPLTFHGSPDNEIDSRDH